MEWTKHIECVVESPRVSIVFRRVSSRDRGRELRASERGLDSAVRFADMVSDRWSQRDGLRLMATDWWLIIGGAC